MENKFVVKNDESIKESLIKIESNKAGIVFVTEDDKIIGCATDGDIRRALINRTTLDESIRKCINNKFVFLTEKNATRENILKLLDSEIKKIPILSEDMKLISIVSKDNIDWNQKEKIISKAKSPVRISFAGGGTDLTNYFYEDDGVVLNATINKFAHAILEKREDSKIKINSNDFKIELNFNSISDISYDNNLDLVKAVIKLLNPEYGFELYIYSDVPPGSGLGGSAVLLSAIIGAFNNFRENKLTDYEIAELAFHAERIELGLSGGWQDQYATVFGGFNFMEFKNNDNIINPLRIPNNIENELEDALILCYTGISHNSGDIHDVQKENMKKTDIKYLATSAKSIANEMKTNLLKGNLDNFGELLDKSWRIKRKFSDNISNTNLDEIYEYAMNNGALGGKLLGAGGGGFFLFYVPTYKKLNLINKLKERKYEIETFTFDKIGLRSWITKEKV